jgi:hypothetical protein
MIAVERGHWAILRHTANNTKLMFEAARVHAASIRGIFHVNSNTQNHRFNLK